MKTKTEVSTEIRNLLEEHPNLPIMVLAPSVCGDYDSYYHDATDASVVGILKPDDVKRQCGDYEGLNPEKYYNDYDDAAEDVSECLFDSWMDHAIRHGCEPFHKDKAPDDILTEFCGYEYDYTHDVSMATMADNLASEIVNYMPWQDYIVIKCY